MSPIRVGRLFSVTTAVFVTLWLAGCGRNPDQEWTDACQAPTVTSHRASAAARSALLEALQSDGGSGISAAVMIDGQLVWRDAVGFARYDPESSLNPSARMRIGSVSKSFTGIAAARLAESGALDLDAPLHAYVAEVPASLSNVTARQLAHHTSGMRHYDFSSFSDSNNTAHYETLAAAFATFEDPMTGVPGDAFVYSSPGYNLLGIAIENATGAPYEQALRDLVTGPMGLTSTMTDDSTRFTPCRTEFYTVMFGKFRMRTIWRDNSDLYPSGGLIATAEDLTRFAHETFGGELLTNETQRLLTRRPLPGDVASPAYGFGWELARDAHDEIEWVGHGGTINGAYASLRYYPRHRISIAAIANYNLGFTSQAEAFFVAVQEKLPALFEPDG